MSDYLVDNTKWSIPKEYDKNIIRVEIVDPRIKMSLSFWIYTMEWLQKVRHSKDQTE